METAINNIDTEAEIKSILNARIKAIYNKDLEAVISNYSPNYISFDLKEPLQNKGIEGVKLRLAEWFKSYKSPISQELDSLKIETSNNLAFSYCLTRTFGTNANGEANDMWYRTTTCFHKMDNKWIIVHQHDSEPIDMETGKAMFNLSPI